jgi:hypothetical protein
MLLPLAVAATVLASPAPPVPSNAPPKGAVLLVIDAGEPGTRLESLPTRTGAVARPDVFLGGLLDRFAVVKPHRTGPDAAAGLHLFVLVAPWRGQLGVQAVGSF